MRSRNPDLAQRMVAGSCVAHRGWRSDTARMKESTSNNGDGPPFDIRRWISLYWESVIGNMARRRSAFVFV